MLADARARRSCRRTTTRPASASFDLHAKIAQLARRHRRGRALPQGGARGGAGGGPSRPREQGRDGAGPDPPHRAATSSRRGRSIERGAALADETGSIVARAWARRAQGELAAADGELRRGGEAVRGVARALRRDRARRCRTPAPPTRSPACSGGEGELAPRRAALPRGDQAPHPARGPRHALREPASARAGPARAGPGRRGGALRAREPRDGRPAGRRLAARRRGWRSGSSARRRGGTTRPRSSCARRSTLIGRRRLRPGRARAASRRSPQFLRERGRDDEAAPYEARLAELAGGSAPSTAPIA